MALTLERLIALVPEDRFWFLRSAGPSAFPLDVDHVICRLSRKHAPFSVVTAYGPTAAAAMTDCLVELGVKVPYR